MFQIHTPWFPIHMYIGTYILTLFSVYRTYPVCHVRPLYMYIGICIYCLVAPLHYCLHGLTACIVRVTRVASCLSAPRPIRATPAKDSGLPGP